MNRGAAQRTSGARGRLALACLLPAAALLAGCASAPGPDARPAPEVGTGSAGAPRVVIWISVAGLTPDRYLAVDPAMPTLAAMAHAGVAAERVASVTPAATYPVHATLVTGLAPNVHGIPADLRIGDRGVRPAPHRQASLLRAVPLWQRVGEAGGRVLALDWPGTLGADVAGLVPDIHPERPGQLWHLLAANASSASLAGFVRAAPGAGRPGAARDELLTGIACSSLGAEEPPTLVLLRLRRAEGPLMQGGPRSPAARDGFAAVDAQLAHLLGCLGPLRAEVAFVVSGDVVYEPVHTMLRPNAVLSGAGVPAGGSRGWEALARSNGGSSFVYARSEEAALQARRTLGRAARASGAFRIVGAEEMIARQADPEAWFGLAAGSGFIFVDDPNGAPEAPARVLGAGGYLEEATRPTPGFVFWGRGVRSGVRVPVFSLLDAGPTVGKLLGVALEPSSGRPRLGLLRIGGSEPRRSAGE